MEEKRKSILIVEDEDKIRTLLELELSPLGDIHLANSGFDALDKLEHQKFDLCITDIVMANLSGLNLVKEMKRLEYNTKVLIISGVRKEEDLRRVIDFKHYNIFEFHDKSDDISRLFDKVKEIINS